MGCPVIPALLAIYNTYLTYRAANGGIPGTWEEVSARLNLPGFIGDSLAVQAARALATQREGIGAGADELWTAVPAGVSAGTAAGLRTIAEALIWTSLHDLQTTKDEDGGLVPTLENPPLELADLVAQSVSAAAQAAAAAAAGWRYKTWRTRRDSHVRDTHRELEGVKISLGESFHTRDGDTLLYPGDPAADIGNRIGCRCFLQTSR
jgi:hypothetical protein